MSLYNYKLLKSVNQSNYPKPVLNANYIICGQYLLMHMYFEPLKQIVIKNKKRNKN